MTNIVEEQLGYNKKEEVGINRKKINEYFLGVLYKVKISFKKICLKR